MRMSIIAGAIAVAVLATACGGSPPTPVGADGVAVTLPTPADGPVPELPVDAEAAASPLPDIAVRQLNGDGGWVQLKNELPADRAVLVWFWAPH